MNSITPEYRIFDFVITTGNTIKSTATVTLGSKTGKTIKTRYGDGPIDAAYSAINSALQLDLSREFESGEDAAVFWKTREYTLEKFAINAESVGIDSLGKTTVTLRYGETRCDGSGIDNDIVYSAIKAYIAAVNELVPAIRADIEAYQKATR